MCSKVLWARLSGFTKRFSTRVVKNMAVREFACVDYQGFFLLKATLTVYEAKTIVNPKIWSSVIPYNNPITFHYFQVLCVLAVCAVAAVTAKYGHSSQHIHKHEGHHTKVEFKDHHGHHHYDYYVSTLLCNHFLTTRNFIENLLWILKLVPVY